MDKITQTLDREKLKKKFSGETSQSLSCLDHTEVTFVRGRTKEKMLEECLMPSVKDGGVMVLIKWEIKMG